MREKGLVQLFRHGGTVFTPEELAVIWGISNYDYVKTKIAHYIKKGYLTRIARGIYVKDSRDYELFELANKLRSPSYISLETVLLKEGVVFQADSRVSLVSYFSQTITVAGRQFIYKKIKDNVLFDHRGINDAGHYFIAGRERAFLDMLYLYKDYHFDNLASMDWNAVSRLAEIYGSKTILKKVEEYRKNAGSR
jgi:predicted transcriptional regulator of viral defense system